jgi:hypothetical protein
LSAISLSAVSAVRDAQERLREAHQHDALLRGESVLLQEGLDAGLAFAPAAGRDDERDRLAANCFAIGVGQPREREQFGDDGFLVCEVMWIDRTPGSGVELAVDGTQEPECGGVAHPSILAARARRRAR